MYFWVFFWLTPITFHEVQIIFQVIETVLSVLDKIPHCLLKQLWTYISGLGIPIWLHHHQIRLSSLCLCFFYICKSGETGTSMFWFAFIWLVSDQTFHVFTCHFYFLFGELSKSFAYVGGYYNFFLHPFKESFLWLDNIQLLPILFAGDICSLTVLTFYSGFNLKNFKLFFQEF